MLIYRQDAPSLIQNVVISFAFTVIAIRIFLQFSPITIIVVGNFHVAHMLWGGLLLLLAALLIFTFQNRKILEAASWLVGIGFGFFIDEIGKYVSLDNDYYYKLAAPLIYVWFLIVVFIWFSVRRKAKHSLLERLYYAIDDLKGILENQLYKSDFAEMTATFKEVVKTSLDDNQREIAENMLELLPQIKGHVLKDRRSRVEVMIDNVREIGREIFEKRTARALFYLAFIVRILWVIPSLLLPLVAFSEDRNTALLRQTLIESGIITGNREWLPYSFMVVMEVTVAAGLLLGLGFLLLKKRGGIWLIRRLLLFSILVLAIFNVYFGQFSALVAVCIDASLLFIITKLDKHRLIGYH